MGNLSQLSLHGCSISTTHSQINLSWYRVGPSFALFLERINYPGSCKESEDYSVPLDALKIKIWWGTSPSDESLGLHVHIHKGK